jgi:hypothetical protein
VGASYLVQKLFLVLQERVSVPLVVQWQPKKGTLSKQVSEQFSEEL